MAFSAPTVVGSAAPTVASTTTAITLGGAVTQDDVLLVAYGQGGTATISSMADTAGQSWAIQNLSPGTAQRVSGFAVATPALAMPPGGTITITWSASSTPAVIVMDIPTGGFIAAADAANGTGPSVISASPSCPTGALAFAQEICVGVICDQSAGGSPTAPSWTPVTAGQAHATGQVFTTTYYTLPGSSQASQTCSATVTASFWSDSVITFYLLAGVTGTWTANRAITAGTGTPIPAPPSMPLACPVASTGAAGNGLVAFLGWTLPPGYLGADMTVTDDAHNVWQPLGAPACSSPATGFTRSSIWAAPGAFAAGNVYMNPVGLPGPCYPAVMGITVIEVAGMSPYLGSPLTATAVQNSAGTISSVLAPPGAFALQLATAASDGTASLSGPGTGWTALTPVSASGGGYSLQAAPAWQVTAAAGTATWTSSPHADLSAATAEILLANPLPVPQPNPNWPAFQFSAGFGSGALTPAGQVAWTDISPRWLAGAQTEVVTGKQYELDQVEAAQITATLDDNDGALTPQNAASPFFPNVVADLPLRLLAWWAGRTYGVLAGFAERFPVTWEDGTWYGLTETEIADSWSLQQNQLTSVLRQEELWDPNLYALWPCSDPQFSSGNTPTLSAINIAPGNGNNLQQVTSKNGILGTISAAFGTNGGGLPGDSSGTFWQQSGLTTVAEGYGNALFCADQGYPPLSGGITVSGWFNPLSPSAGVAQAQITNQATFGGIAGLILLRASNAGSGPAFQVSLATTTAAHPGSVVMTVWDVSTRAATATTVDTGNWLEAGWFRVTAEINQGTWNLFLNGVSAGTGTCNLPSSVSWLQFMGSADRFYTGSMLNGACGHLAVYSVELTPDREQSIYLAGTPAPAIVAGGASAFRGHAQFTGEFPAPRIERLLAYGGWTGARSISQSSVTQMAAITDIQGNTAVISPAGQVTVSAGGQQAGQAVSNIVFSDGGFIFTDSLGVLCYLSRGDFYLLQPAWTLGENVPGGETPYLPDAALGYDKSLLYNAAQLTPSNSVTGTPVQAVNVSSVAQHGQYVYNATAYQNLIAQVADEATWIVNTRGTPQLRAEALTADSKGNTGVWPFLLGVQPAQPATISRRPQTAAYSVTVTPLITQVTKALDFEAGTATAEIRTDVFPEGNVMIIGSATQGLANGVNVLGW